MLAGVEMIEPFEPRKIRLGGKEALLAGLLRDFSPHEVQAAAVEILVVKEGDHQGPAMEPLLSAVEDTSNIPAPDVVAEVEAARVAAFAAGLVQGRKEMQAELTQQFDAARAEWETAQQKAVMAAKLATTTELAANMEETLQTGLEMIRRQIEYALSVLIADLVNRSLTKAALADFAAKITTEAMAVGEGGLIIEGKKELLDAFALQTSLPRESYQLQETALNEIRVVLADRAISTRLAPLMQELENLISYEAR